MVMGDMEMSVDLAVIGAGPGGFSAAFRAADLGLDVALIDPHPTPGGNYLYHSCIPARILFHIVRGLSDAKNLNRYGVDFGEPQLDLSRITGFRDRVVTEIGKRLSDLAKERGIQRIKGTCRFESETRLQIEGADISRISFRSSVIAAGSTPASLNGFRSLPGNRVLNNRNAFTLKDIPTDILIVGASALALEAGLIYHGMGSNVYLASPQNRLLPQVDPDLVLPLHSRIDEMVSGLYLDTDIKGVTEHDNGLEVEMSTGDKRHKHSVARLLIADSLPGSEDLGLEQAGISLDSDGGIPTDEQQRTCTKNIFAVGSAAGYRAAPHIAMRQGRVSAEAIAGMPSAFDVLAVPHVLMTDPQICWCGLSEQEAKQLQIAVTTHSRDWCDTPDAKINGSAEGFTKFIADPESGRLLGVGICGSDSESLIGEASLAVEMGCLVEDLALTLHPHLSPSETFTHCAEDFMGTSIFTQLSRDKDIPPAS